MPMPSLLKNSSDTIKPKDRRVRTFPKGICPKVNIIARVEFAYNDSVVHRFNHYATRTPPQTLRNFV